MLLHAHAEYAHVYRGLISDSYEREVAQPKLATTIQICFAIGSVGVNEGSIMKQSNTPAMSSDKAVLLSVVGPLVPLYVLR